MEMLAVVCLAIVWAAFLVPPLLRRHREGRPASSVVSFRRQLSTLERATPGTSLRPLQPYRATPVVASGPGQMNRSQVVRRRRDILVGLLAATAFTFLLAVVLASTITMLLFVATGGALGAYVYALVQLRQRADEASVKVRVLRPQTVTARPATFAVRRSASS